MSAAGTSPGGSVRHVILAGGSGIRFWPLSRSARPKQFLCLAGDRPLVRQAFDRAASMAGSGQVFVAAGAGQRAMVFQALPGLAEDRFLEEPVGRNTGPCIGLAASRLHRIDPDGLMVVAPADHVYRDGQAFRQAIGAALQAAGSTGRLVTLGIHPSRPETGYGYIEASGDPGVSGVARQVARFVEKPDAATAQRFLDSGRYLWNSGVFVWRTSSILEAIRRHAPEIWSGLEAIRAAAGGRDEGRITSEAFTSMPSISIDYAVMEKSADVMVVACDPGWSDVGSWDAAAELHETDAAGNASSSGTDSLLIGSRDCFVTGGPGRPVALVGCEDLIVVDAGDALLVCRRGRSQEVRAVVEALRARGRGDLL